DAGKTEDADQVEPPGPLLRVGEDGYDGQEGDHVHDLDQRVEGRAGGILQGVADGVAGDGRLVRLRALAAVEAVFDRLLGVVPGAARVGHEDGQELANNDHACEVAGQGLPPE